MAEDKSKALVLSKLSAPVFLKFEPVGRWYESRVNHVKGLGDSDDSSSSDDEDDDAAGGSGEAESVADHINPLLLDPTQWKDQDHYAILGLGKLRHKATKEDIKRAYRQKVLTHHPDKQSAEAQQSEGDDLFKCIKIANDILSDPKRRRAYDSVDPTFDEAVPSISSQSKENFYKVFRPVFEQNGRWSTRQPVPLLGDENSSLEDVEMFYAFWYDFVSWREFSYLDEENLESAQSREERRWMEKQNKLVRQKRKKEDAARIRTLVDNAYSCDPRVKRFKEQEKEEKEAKKRAKREAARQEALEREREQQQKLEEEQKRKEREEEEAKAQAAQAKKEKEAVKKALRKERKALRALCKNHNYFASSDSEVVAKMQDVERLCNLLTLEKLQQMNEQLAALSLKEAEAVVEREVKDLDRQEKEKMAAAASATQSKATQGAGASATDSDWTMDEVQLLVKAVTLFPAGTVKRWDTIAKYVNAHSGVGSSEKSAKQVISKVKTLQKLEGEEKTTQNKMAFSRFEQQHVSKVKVKVRAEAAPTERYDVPQPWSSEEQKLLEKALRTYPSSVADRWDKIAELVKTRTKEECITRFKELVARVKAKKQQT